MTNGAKAEDGDRLPRAVQEELLRILAATVDVRPILLRELCAKHPEYATALGSQVLRFEHLQGRVDVAAGRTSRDPDSHAHDADEGIGRFIGPYRILARLGSGGMGVVYLAEQTVPVRRRVAVKLIKLGMDTEQVLRRFEAERQALAMMEHDNIARVFDAGSSDSGRPYFVMEYVRGVPVSQYCDEQRLTVRDRLNLFQKISSGVQHAHHKGIIHRDLKPGNILVTVQGEAPVPKIIDFGLARATDHRLIERTLFTECGRVIGTPEYMSPEQAGINGLDVDSRTDVYSLGVLLYELLTGDLPFRSEELRRAGLDEMRRKIREDEPPKPSTRISHLLHMNRRRAELRGTDLRTLRRHVRGDLDWIAMKALEKDRTRRYDTPNALAQDIDRHLNHRPVEAGPPSATYRLKKLVVRHRAQLQVVVTSLACASFAVVGAGWFWAESALAAEIEYLPQPSELALIEPSDLTAVRERVQELVDTHRHIQRLRSRYGPLAGAQEQRVLAIEATIAAVAGDVADVASSTIGAALDSGADTPSGVDLAELSAAISLLEQSSLLLPDAESVRASGILKAINPHVSIRSEPPGAAVFLRPLSPNGLPIAGAKAEFLGRTSLRRVPVQRGYYRVTIIGDDGRSAESTNLFSSYGHDYELALFYLRSAEEATKGMVLITGSRDGQATDSYVPAFYIDRHEVTNRDYREFCIETKHAKPIGWPEDYETSWKPEWDDLPVAWVDVHDAHAYAAWAGKRLPMAIEWDRAAQGPHGWPYPWGTRAPSEAELDRLCNVRHKGSRHAGGQLWSDYLASVRLIGSHPDGASPDGVHETFGNLSEWTDTMAMGQVEDGVSRPQPGLRDVKGNSWQRSPRPLTGAFLVVAESTDSGIGFRCAKSADSR